ncbi:MAG: peptidoglycan-binding protein [Pseudomonadota bacterium]
MRYVVWLCAALALVLPDIAPANPMKGNCRATWREYERKGQYRAFASSRDRYTSCGSAWNYPSQSAADSAALRNCRKKSRSCSIISNTRMEQAARQTKTETRRIQNALNDLGYNVGAADGAIGPATRRGIRLFQKSIFATQNGTLSAAQKRRLFDLQREAKVRKRTGLQRVGTLPKATRARDLTLDNQTQTIAGFVPGQGLVLWDVGSLKVLANLPAPGGDAASVAIDGSGRLAVMSTKTGTLMQWSLQDGRVTETALGTALNHLVFGANGQEVLGITEDGALARVDLSSGRLTTLAALDHKVIDLDYHAETGRLFALTDTGQLLSAADLSQPPVPVTLGGVAPDARITAMSLDRVGDMFVIGTAAGAVRVFEVKDGVWVTKIAMTTNAPVVAVDVRASGRSVAILTDKAAEVRSLTIGTAAPNDVTRFTQPLKARSVHLTRSGRLLVPAAFGGYSFFARGGSDLLAAQNGQKQAARRLKGRQAALQKHADQLAEAAAARRADANKLFEAGDCAAFDALDAVDRGGRTVANCEAAAEVKRRDRAVNAALAEGACEAAQSMAEGASAFKAGITKCYADRKRAEDEARFASAVSDGDCALVAELEGPLGKDGAADTCRFNAAMTAPTARRMYLAAARYDASDDRARAKLLYLGIMDRFPDDDLALDAATRLTSLNDLERTEKERAEMEARMKRLQREAKDAQRAAEAARKRAEDAQARAAARAREAQRQADAQRLAAERQRAAASTCGHVWEGKRVRITGKLPQTTKQALGFILQGGLYGSNFEVLGKGRTQATLRSLDTGRTFNLPCRNIP